MDWIRALLPKMDLFRNPDIRCTSKTQTHKTSIVWSIENFSDLPEKVGYFVESSVFFAESDTETKWSLKLYPNGDEEEHKEFISLFLFLKEYNRDVSVRYSFALIDGNNQLFKQSELKYCFEKTWGYGYSDFVKRSILKDYNSLPNDVLTIYCKINAFDKCEPISCQKTDPKTKHKTLTDYMSVMFQKGSGCDVEIVVSGHKFSAHKSVLMARSPVFEAMFEHQMKESQQNRVEINDIDKEVFEKVLRFIYTDTFVSEDIETNIESFIAADKYNLDELKSICEEYISTQMSVETVSEVLILADTYTAQELKQKAIEFIKNNSIKVMKTNEWKKIIDRKDLLNLF